MLAPFRCDEVKEGSMFQNSIVPQPASSKDVNKLKERSSETKTVCVRAHVRKCVRSLVFLRCRIPLGLIFMIHNFDLFIPVMEL